MYSMQKLFVVYATLHLSLLVLFLRPYYQKKCPNPLLLFLCFRALSSQMNQARLTIVKARDFTFTYVLHELKVVEQPRACAANACIHLFVPALLNFQHAILRCPSSMSKIYCKLS